MDNWAIFLDNHPIFSAGKAHDSGKTNSGSGPSVDSSLQLSTSSLSEFAKADDPNGTTGRRRTMVVRNSDLIVASGSEIRMTSLADAQPGVEASKWYQSVDAPELDFPIRQISLNSSGKLLAVAGDYEMVVLVLPRISFAKHSGGVLDCRALRIGKVYHCRTKALPIVKADWHPWGEAGSSLLVMTVDGRLREYDVSVDPEEPQQVVTFATEKKSRSFVAQDPSQREVSSFSIGQGSADWGPLTVYAVMRSGDVYAVCPFLPKNAAIPSSYVHALDCFTAAKQDYLSQSQSSSESTTEFSTLFDYQRKYVAALLKQLPPGSSALDSQPVSIRAPSTIKHEPMRQGPFLLQPAPRVLEGSEGGDATDIIYLSFGGTDASGAELERLGAILIAYQDGRVDACIDVEKVEARWSIKQASTPGLPMLAVYETIDLGLVSMLRTTGPNESLLSLLQANFPIFYRDPIHGDIVYVYHAFGVHSLDLASLVEPLADALQRAGEDDGSDSLTKALEVSTGTAVQCIVSTFSPYQNTANPVFALAVPNDVYRASTIFVLTSAPRLLSFSLTLRADTAVPTTSYTNDSMRQTLAIDTTPRDPDAYISLLGTTAYAPSSAFTNKLKRPALPTMQKVNGELVLTAEFMRTLGATVESIRSQIDSIRSAHKEADLRADLQTRELSRQQQTCGSILNSIQALRESRAAVCRKRLSAANEQQEALLGRMEKILRRLMLKASPELSEHERKWFEELNRMRQEVVGVGRFDQQSLKARTALLKEECDRALPLLQSSKQLIRRSTNDNLGVSQASDMKSRLDHEKFKIKQLQEELSHMASQVDINIGRPPS